MISHRRSAAVGAGERGRRSFEVMRPEGVGAGPLGSGRFRFSRPCPWRLARAAVMLVHEQPHDDSRHLLDGQHVIDAPAHRIERHRWGLRLIGILNHRHAPRLFNQGQPVCAVGHVAGQDDADCTGAVMLCRCSKERIHGWAEPVLTRTAGKTDVPAVDNQVIIRRCDIHMSVAGHHAIFGRDHCQPGCAIENTGEFAGAVGRRMDDHEDCGRDVLREFVQERTDRADATGRRSDYNDVGRRHAECSHVTTQKTQPLRNKIRDRFRTEERCICPRRSSQLRSRRRNGR